MVDAAYAAGFIRGGWYHGTMALQAQQQSTKSEISGKLSASFSYAFVSGKRSAELKKNISRCGGHWFRSRLLRLIDFSFSPIICICAADASQHLWPAYTCAAGVK